MLSSQKTGQLFVKSKGYLELNNGDIKSKISPRFYVKTRELPGVARVRKTDE